jgi:hypothetical protein
VLAGRPSPSAARLAGASRHSRAPPRVATV